MYLTKQKKQALELYVNQSYTQQQIADSLGVCVRNNLHEVFSAFDLQEQKY